MLKMSRAQINEKKGIKPPEPAPPPASAAPDLTHVTAALAALAGQVQQTSAAVAALSAREKRIELTIHRDAHGKMTHVSGTVSPTSKE